MDEPRGCPTPGACSCPDIRTLVERALTDDVFIQLALNVTADPIGSIRWIEHWREGIIAALAAARGKA